MQQSEAEDSEPRTHQRIQAQVTLIQNLKESIIGSNQSKNLVASSTASVTIQKVYAATVLTPLEPRIDVYPEVQYCEVCEVRAQVLREAKKIRRDERQGEQN